MKDSAFEQIENVDISSYLNDAAPSTIDVTSTKEETKGKKPQKKETDTVPEAGTTLFRRKTPKTKERETATASTMIRVPKIVHQKIIAYKLALQMSGLQQPSSGDIINECMDYISNNLPTKAKSLYDLILNSGSERTR